MFRREAFDRLTELAMAVFEAPSAFVTMVGDDALTFRSSRDVGSQSVPLCDTFCAHATALGPDATLVIEDAQADPRFTDNPFVAEGLRFYAGAVITTTDGKVDGAVCVTDTRPRMASDAQMAVLRELARMAAMEIDLLREERRQAEREQTLEMAESVAGVGHWRLDRVTGEVWWSDEVYRIHGFEPGQVDPTTWSAEGAYDDEDATRVRALFARALETGEGYDAELRLIRADGSLRHTRTRARSLCDEVGQVTSLFGVFQDITDTVQSRARLEHSEALFRLLTEDASDIVARYRPDGTFLYVSPAVERILGRPAEELIGGNCADIIHLDDVAATFKAMQACLLAPEGEETHVEYRALSTSGEVVWLEASPRPVRDAVGRIYEIHDHVRDITARKAAEAEQAKLVQTLNMAGQMAGLGHWRLDVSGPRVVWSDEVYRIHGVTRETFDPNYGDAVAFYHPDDREAVLAGIGAAIEKGEAGGFKMRLIRADGDERVVQSSWSPEVGPDGAVNALFGVFQDITESERAARVLEDARDRAEAGAKAKSEFLANMSHELRTPLTSVIGFSGLLADSDALPATERRYVDRIATASEALLGVINDILDYSKLEADAVDLDPLPYEPAGLAHAAAGIVEGQCVKRGLTLAVEVDPATPFALVGDSGRLRQVLLNFLSNAAKFTAQGGVTLRMAPAGDRLRVEVNDTGIGVPPEKIDALFERFTQADASTTRTYGGTGLGLAISRRLIEMMGGEIGAFSAPGQGSTFWFEVPLVVADHLTAANGDTVVQAPRGLRVLMADDAPANRELVGALLATLDLELDTVEDGAQAVEAVASGAYDLVLMDVHMPVMDGLAATRAIRALPSPVCATPVIALTANVQPEQVQTCRDAGMNAHVGKPIRAADLIGAMQAVLQVSDEPGVAAA